uniref:YspA cpYpsA-related SLOG domain-containing protein n=1 Tax=Rhodopseudomonas palustris (strain DX-1) TaxID=652103 RepID=E6VQ91_RHOPX
MRLPFRTGNGFAGYFPPPGRPGFASRSKIAGSRHPPLRFGRCRLRFRGAGAVRPPLFVAMKAAMGAVDPPRASIMSTDRDDTSHQHAASPTDHIITELQLYGYRPFQDEPDLRPLPEARTVAGAVADIFDALIATLGETRLEPDLPDLLWSAVNLFHRATERIERELDDNGQAQKRSQRDQDGSEIRSVELERLTAEGMTLIERRDTMEVFRDQAAEHFVRHTGSHWHPRSGSMVNHRALTAAVIDSRDFIAARHRAETELLLPAGPKIAFTGGLDFNDHRLIWSRLDQVHAKHPDMVLLHGGSPKGAELIAARWADHRKVPQIAFKPDWTRYAKAAPFKRNDQMLDVLPIGVLVFPGTGIQDNLADKARKLGIPVWKVGERGA